jgi:hypothetical protein
MTRTNLSSILLSLVFLSVAGCGGSQSSAPAAHLATFDKDVAGYWAPKNASNDAYEFFLSPSDVPLTIPLKTGRILREGKVVDMFMWDYQSDGSIRLNKVGAECPARPLSNCPVTGSAQIVANGQTIQGAAWTFAFLDKNSTTPKLVTDTYTRADVNLSQLPQGEFFLKRSDILATPILGKIEDGKISIRFTEFGKPVFLSAPLGSGAARSVTFSSGQAAAIDGTASFAVQGQGMVALPVKQWYENVHLSATSGGYILDYEYHRKVQVPATMNPSTITGLADYESTRFASRSFGLVNSFVHGPTVRAGDQFDTLLPLDFNPDWVGAAGGNKLQFLTASTGKLSHEDIINGKYTESRNFSWSQAADGTLKMSFDNGTEVTARFVKAVNGGHQVLYTSPHPTLGKSYYLHDFLLHAASPWTEQDVPGRYTFLNTDGQTMQTVVLNKDKSVSGVIGGYWFLDTNGELVSFECTDLLGNAIKSYQSCLANFNDLSTVSFAHVRRLKLLHKDGDKLSFKYDASFYGERFGVSNRDYLTVAFTYQWTRIGNE